MLAQNNLQQLYLSSNSQFQTSLHQVSPNTSSSFLSQDELLSKEEKSEEHAVDSKYTMESLCRSFLKKYCNSSLLIDLSSLADEFNAKLRRIYDMINILEGSEIISKVEKGIYKWKGLLPETQLRKDSTRHEWCSLRSISFEIKRLFDQTKKGLTCHELYNILTNGKTTKFNPATIRRRIYQCCKVFLIVGSIKKFGKCFFNGILTDKDIQSMIKAKIQAETQNDCVNEEMGGFRKMQTGNSGQFNINKTFREQDVNQFNLQQRKSIIRKIANQLKSQSDLQQFIQDLNSEYRSKNLFNLQIIKTSLTFQAQNKFVEEQRIPESCRSWSQVQRNIIVSAPTKREHIILFNSKSNFCSFPSNPVFQTFESVQDIKGK